MENYDFQITPYNTESLLWQVSTALEKRTELISRERYPGLWESIKRIIEIDLGKSLAFKFTRHNWLLLKVIL